MKELPLPSGDQLQPIINNWKLDTTGPYAEEIDPKLFDQPSRPINVNAEHCDSSRVVYAGKSGNWEESK